MTGSTPSGPFRVGGTEIRPGERRRLEIPVARLATQNFISLPVEVVNGARPGVRLWLSAALHGDELNGVEIVHRVLDEVVPEKLAGALVAVPIVNVFGFLFQSRYLPDRRDLNRSFPGSPKGSLASRLAHIFMTEVARHCSHGLDLHSGSNHRTNLPQIRANMEDPETRRCAEAFGAPVIIQSRERKGTLREAAARLGLHVLLYEAGEPQRFNEDAIEVGVRGVLNVMAYLGMLRGRKPKKNLRPVEATRSRWIRARRSGIFRLGVKVGEWVDEKQRLGVIADPFGDTSLVVAAPCAGLVIGHTNNPLVSQGDGLAHLAVEFVRN